MPCHGRLHRMSLLGGPVSGQKKTGRVDCELLIHCVGGAAIALQVSRFGSVTRSVTVAVSITARGQA